MNIVNLKVEELIPYINNPRNNTEAVDKVAASIKEFGFKVPIVIDKDNVVVTGHTRLLASKKLGLEEVPCVIADDLTDAQIKAFRIADNKVSEYAEWDEELLKLELEQLEEMDFDLDELNIDYSDFDLDIGEDIEEIEPEEVEVPEVPEEPKAKLGDIYQLGNHRLMCGDSTSIDDVSKLMNGVKADMVFTDPPYGYKYESNYQDKYKMLENDDKILDYIPAILPFLKECSIYSFCGWQSVDKWISYFKNTSLLLKNMIIWKKNNWRMGDLKCSYAGQYEICLYLNNGKKELNGKRYTDVWEFDREPPKLHPTMKPINLIAFALKNSSNINDIIIDVFGGSGSTLIACEQLNRKCYMMELDPHYVDVIIKRWEDYTGNKAVKLE